MTNNIAIERREDVEERERELIKCIEEYFNRSL
jgi:hypothetical protein